MCLKLRNINEALFGFILSLKIIVNAVFEMEFRLLIRLLRKNGYKV